MKKLTATLTNFTRTHTLKNDHRYFNGTKVFRESNVTKMIDDWFMDNGVYKLDFKSKTWTKLMNLVNKIETQAIHQNLGLRSNGTVRFSRKAGCRCGCSPGFLATEVPAELINMNVWVKMEFTSNLEELLPEFTEMLKKEIEKNSN